MTTVVPHGTPGGYAHTFQVRAVDRAANVGAEVTWSWAVTSITPNTRLLEKPESLIRFVPDRPGHDRRYGLDASRIRTELGWRPRHRADEGLAATVEWYRSNEAWWSRVLTEAYRATNALYIRTSA